MAITWSCNSFFFTVFRMIVDQHGDVENGLMAWKAYMNSFGLGHKLGVDLPGEKDGNIPDTTHFNKIFGRKHWNSCSLVSLGIGQGETTETPLQMANAMCMIANNGYYYTPHIVDSIADGDTGTRQIPRPSRHHAHPRRDLRKGQGWDAGCGGRGNGTAGPGPGDRHLR